MSAEPKRDLAERIHAEADIASRAGQSDRLRVLAAEVRGYVSPEEATAREAAARREALLEVQSRLQPPPPWPATGSEAPDRGYDAGWSDALAVVEELLAEPERDEEGSDV